MAAKDQGHVTGRLLYAGSGLWPGGQRTHSTHWTLGMDTRSLSPGGPGAGGEAGGLQVDTSGPHLCVDSCGAGRRFRGHHVVGTAQGWHCAGLECPAERATWREGAYALCLVLLWPRGLGRTSGRGGPVSGVSPRDPV